MLLKQTARSCLLSLAEASQRYHGYSCTHRLQVSNRATISNQGDARIQIGHRSLPPVLTLPRNGRFAVAFVACVPSLLSRCFLVVSRVAKQLEPSKKLKRRLEFEMTCQTIILKMRPARAQKIKANSQKPKIKWSDDGEPSYVRAEI